MTSGDTNDSNRKSSYVGDGGLEVSSDADLPAPDAINGRVAMPTGVITIKKSFSTANHWDFQPGKTTLQSDDSLQIAVTYTGASTFLSGTLGASDQVFFKSITFGLSGTDAELFGFTGGSIFYNSGGATFTGTGGKEAVGLFTNCGQVSFNNASFTGHAKGITYNTAGAILLDTVQFFPQNNSTQVQVQMHGTLAFGAIVNQVVHSAKLNQPTFYISESIVSEVTIADCIRTPSGTTAQSPFFKDDLSGTISSFTAAPTNPITQMLARDYGVDNPYSFRKSNGSPIPFRTGDKIVNTLYSLSQVNISGTVANGLRHSFRMTPDPTPHAGDATGGTTSIDHTRVNTVNTLLEGEQVTIVSTITEYNGTFIAKNVDAAGFEIAVGFNGTVSDSTWTHGSLDQKDRFVNVFQTAGSDSSMIGSSVIQQNVTFTVQPVTAEVDKSLEDAGSLQQWKTIGIVEGLEIDVTNGQIKNNSNKGVNVFIDYKIVLQKSSGSTITYTIRGKVGPIVNSTTGTEVPDITESLQVANNSETTFQNKLFVNIPSQQLFQFFVRSPAGSTDSVKVQGKSSMAYVASLT